MNIDIESSTPSKDRISTTVKIEPKTILECFTLTQEIYYHTEYRTAFENFIESIGLCQDLAIIRSYVDNGTVLFYIQLYGAEELIKGKEKLIIEYIKERV